MPRPAGRPFAGRLAIAVHVETLIPPVSMKTRTPPARCPEFYFAQLDTLVRVERSGDAVTIRATRDTFSVRRKEYFIHELAAEGFIDDGYQWFSLGDIHSARPIRWLVDFTWLGISPELTAAARRFMLRMLGAAAMLWVGLMTALFTGAIG